MAAEDWPTVEHPRATPLVSKLGDISGDVLLEIKDYISRSGLTIPISQIIGYRQFNSTWLLSTLGNDNLANNAAGVPVANQAVLGPIQNFATPITVTTIGFNIVTQSGNMDVGIYYSDDGATFTKLVSTGSFATPATGYQTRAVASSDVTPSSASLTTGAKRKWYTGFATDNTTMRIYNHAGYFNLGYNKASSFPLPATISSPSVVSQWNGLIAF